MSGNGLSAAAARYLVDAVKVRAGEVVALWDEEQLEHRLVEVLRVWEPDIDGVVQFTLRGLDGGAFTHYESFADKLVVVIRWGAA